MAESIFIPQKAGKKSVYEALVPQMEAILGAETDLTANLANFSAVLKEAFGFFWVGFYWVKNQELILAPFQGTLACTRIAKGKGVCGAAWQEQKTILVPDVEAFPGHIACSSLYKSEIVIPVFYNDEVVGVLDVDSDQLNDFGQEDQAGLEALIKILEKYLPKMLRS